MAPKRKKKVSHEAGEAERRLWQYLAVYITLVLLFFFGTLVRFDLEAADGEQKEVESFIVKSETVKQVTTEKKQEEFTGRRAVYTESCFTEPSWIEIFIVQIVVPQFRYPFFLTLLVFLVGKKLARKKVIGDDEAIGILVVASILACAGTFLFLAGEGNSGLLIASGFLVITCGLLAGMAFVGRKESKWLAAVPPFTALTIEIAYYFCKTESLLESLA